MWLKGHTNDLYFGLEYVEIFVIKNRLPAINDSGSWRLPHRLLQALLVTPRIVGSGKSISITNISTDSNPKSKRLQQLL